MPLIALVGYTNAGKSTLLHALTGADIYIADQLFATLDPTTRRLELPSKRTAVITDTVGFIQKLPTTLIAAFQATLEEIKEADLLLEVADATHPNVMQHIETVDDTLAEIDVPPVPKILVWNKVDQLHEDDENLILQQVPEGRYTRIVKVSALTGQGIPELMFAIEEVLAASLYAITLKLPYDRGDLVSLIHEQASVESSLHTSDGIEMKARVSAALLDRLLEFRV